jgi:methylglyoxal synthase
LLINIKQLEVMLFFSTPLVGISHTASVQGPARLARRDQAGVDLTGQGVIMGSRRRYRHPRYNDTNDNKAHMQESAAAN